MTQEIHILSDTTVLLNEQKFGLRIFTNLTDGSQFYDEATGGQGESLSFDSTEAENLW